MVTACAKPTGFGPLEFDYVTSTNAVRQSNQELIKTYWEQIGVKANMQNEDASLFFDGTCASDACIWKFFTPMQMFTNGARPVPTPSTSTASPAQIPTSATSWGGDNIPRLNNAEFDAARRARPRRRSTTRVAPTSSSR